MSKNKDQDIEHSDTSDSNPAKVLKVIKAIVKFFTPACLFITEAALEVGGPIASEIVKQQINGAHMNISDAQKSMLADATANVITNLTKGISNGLQKESTTDATPLIGDSDHS